MQSARQPGSSPADGLQQLAESATVSDDQRYSKLPPVTQLAANSPCMVKSDLREFIVAQKKAVDVVVANNPNVEDQRNPYTWPTRSIGQQVGGSFTKVTASDSSGQRSCGSGGKN